VPKLPPAVNPAQPNDWRSLGLHWLRVDRADLATDALMRAEHEGDADAAYALGIAHYRLRQLVEAEDAWLRILRDTSHPLLRQAAGEQLIRLYRELGSPSAAARMSYYLATLCGSRPAPIPKSCVRRDRRGRYRARPRSRLLERWEQLVPFWRWVIATVSALASLYGVVEGAQWATRLLR
jgi:hypothetical protein